MKRLLLLSVLAAFGAASLYYVAGQEPGYVYLSWFGYSVEMTAWVLLATLVLLLLILGLGFKLVLACIKAPLKFGRWAFGVNESKLQKQTAHALAAYEEGHWLRARKLLHRVAKRSHNPLVFYLMAAKASHRLDDNKRVSEYLHLAEEASASGAMAVSLTQAQLQLQDQALENCLATLMRAHAIDEAHPEVLRMLAEVYSGLQDWPALYELLPQLQRVLNKQPEHYQQLAQDAACGLLKQAASTGTSELKQQWRDFNPAIKAIEAVLLCYCRLLEQHQEPDQALIPLQRYLKQQPQQALALLCYAKLARQVNAAEGLKFLLALPKADATMALYVAQAQLAQQQQLAGQVRGYLQQAVAAPQPTEQALVTKRLQAMQLIQALRSGDTHNALDLAQAQLLSC